jgi:hypothetical protein
MPSAINIDERIYHAIDHVLQRAGAGTTKTNTPREQWLPSAAKRSWRSAFPS